MGKGRLEAFSDGVIATLMELKLKVSPGTELAALEHLLLVFLSYLLSFIYVGIYCNKLQQANYPSRYIQIEQCPRYREG